MYMVIHDLKHPTEAMINSLGVLEKGLNDHSKYLGQLSKFRKEVFP